jgi:hypothetical protein
MVIKRMPDGHVLFLSGWDLVDTTPPFELISSIYSLPAGEMVASVLCESQFLPCCNVPFELFPSYENGILCNPGSVVNDRPV